MSSFIDHAAERPGAACRLPQSFQRAITLSARPGQVDGRVEDNVHDFSVAIAHDGVRVQQIRGGAHRVPWISCPGAVQALDALLGAPLVGGLRVDPAGQCTHLFDLARLAMAQAARGGPRLYNIAIVAEPPVGAARAQLWRDGDAILDWRLDGDVVIKGDQFVGHRTSGRAIWPDGVGLRPDLVEAALVLRRCLLVFRGRQRGDGDGARASDLPHMEGACFSFQPKRWADAVRPAGFIDYAEAPKSNLATS